MRILRRLCVFLLLLPVLSLAAPLDGPSFSLSAKDLLDWAGPADASNPHGVTVLLDETELTFDADNRVHDRRHLIYRIDAANAIQGWSEAGARWSPWYQAKPAVRARVVTPDGVVHELDAKALSDAPAGDSRPEVFDQTRIISGPLPALQVGAVVEEEEVISDTQPFAHAGIARQVPFGRHAPVRETRLVVDAPASTPLKYGAKLLPQLTITKELRDGRVHITFVQEPMAAVENAEADLPSDVPTWPIVTLSTAPSWQAVDAEYGRALEKQLASGISGITLPAAGKDRTATIAALLALLHQQVRYTGLEFGDGSLVPRTPGETFQRKYGDCKDKAAALIAMLRARGIPAELALLRAGPGADVDPDFPGMGLFDHAIVYVPGSPDLWIDATSEFAAVGTLPYQDRGRLALLIAGDTTKLTKIPDARPEDNVDAEAREFVLPEYGPAGIVETSDPRGTLSASFRSQYGFAADKGVHDSLESYVKREYLADSLTKLDHGAATDLGQPFQLRLEVAKGRRGDVDLDEGVVAVRLESLFYQFPKYLKSAPAENNADHAPSEPPRVHDVAFEPFITEWHYKIVPPPGYTVRSLPASQDRAIGPAHLNWNFETTADGSVTGTLRFNSGKGRYSPAEAEVVRKAIAELSNGQPLLVNFENEGAALIGKGKIREGLQAYRSVIARDPKDAIHHLQIARALLDLGLGDEARREAREAVRLDPQSALAEQTLAWILQHDLLGRRFHRGFDLDGAVAAYRAAITLDPNDADTHINLAILLEHDRNGDRYAPQAKLDDAIAEYRAARKLKDDPATSYADNLYYALDYARHFDEVKTELAKVPQTSQRLKLLLVAIAATDGPALAIAEVQKARDASARATILDSAGQILRDLRMYGPAADLIEASVQNGNSDPKSAAQVQNLRSIKPYEQILFPDSDPRSTVQRLYLDLLDPSGLSPAAVKDLEYTVDGAQRLKSKILTMEAGSLQSNFHSLDLPLPVATDAMLSLAVISSEGDDHLGYRVRMQAAGNPLVFFVARRGAKYQIIGAESSVEGVGLEVLDRLQKNDATAAKTWLDRVREEVTISGGDDPLAWPVFPRLWNRGDAPDPARMRLAAISLVADTDSGLPYLEPLHELRAKLSAPADQNYGDVVLATLLEQAKKWEELRQVSTRLLQAYPASDLAFHRYMSACTHLGEWTGCENAIADRLKRLPDDVVAIRSRAELAAYRNRPDEVRAAYKTLIDSGRATPQDLNGYSWNALFSHVTDADLRLAQQANSSTQNSNYAILHTLAALYADLGKTKEARETLLHLMDVTGVSEPDTEVWYVFGRIAEQYGDSGAALAAYQRMNMSEFDGAPPLTTKDLALARVAQLQHSGAAAAK